MTTRAQIAKAVRTLEQRKAQVAKARDNLRDAFEEVESLLEDCDVGIEDIEEGIRGIRRGIDQISGLV